MKTISSIQVLRGVAAFMVALFHFQPGFVLGAAGVDIFFVISGFIMGYRGAKEAPAEFIVNRLIRIAPLYWLFTLVMCAASLAGVFSNFTFDASSLLKSLLFIPYWTDGGKLWPLMVVGWTLNIEMFFYAVFTIGLAFSSPIAFTSIALIAVVAAGALFHSDYAAFQLWTSPIILEFIAGLLIARYPVRGTLLGCTLLAAGLAGFCLDAYFGLYDESYRVITWGIPALMIVTGCLAIEREGFWPNRMGFLVLLGNASYSLYLTHGFVSAAVHKFLPNGPLSTLVGMAAAIIFAIAVYKLIEVPMLGFLRRKVRKHGQPRVNV